MSTISFASLDYINLRVSANATRQASASADTEISGGGGKDKEKYEDLIEQHQQEKLRNTLDATSR